MKFYVPEAEAEIRRLRKESERYRWEAKHANEENARLRAELGELRPEGLLTLGESYAALRQERGSK